MLTVRRSDADERGVLRGIETLLPQEPATPPASPGSRTSARNAFVTIVVGLSLWGLLFAPHLERNAEAGPIGARRTAALAMLRPLLAISDALYLSRAASSVERALGQDPAAPAGGELELPELELPPIASQPTPVPPAPNGSGAPTVEPAPDPGSGGDDPSEVEVRGLRTPTRSNPLRVAVIGDSLSQGLGPAIERWMDPQLVRVLSLGRQSTGLSRRDYFDWHVGMRQIVERFRPDLVFVMLGSNDAQDQIARDGTAIPVGSVEWVQGYREQAERLLRRATRASTRVAWVGIPVVAERGRWDFYRRVNAVYRDVARADPLATYVDTWSAFEAKGGAYTAFVRNERGDLVEMRAPDGIHFTPNGYAYLGRLAIRAAADAFGLAPEAATFRI